MVNLTDIARASVSAVWVRKIANAALASVKKAGANVSIVFVTDAQIAKLNAQYRKKRGPTDVLSFSAEGGPRAADLGDIFISPVSTKRKAKERGSAYRPYLALLITHGILHLAGYDHEKGKDAEKMERKERNIIGRLKI